MAVLRWKRKIIKIGKLLKIKFKMNLRTEISKRTLVKMIIKQPKRCNYSKMMELTSRMLSRRSRKTNSRRSSQLGS
jgi:hypothetical protein